MRRATAMPSSIDFDARARRVTVSGSVDDSFFAADATSIFAETRIPPISSCRSRAIRDFSSSRTVCR